MSKEKGGRWVGQSVREDLHSVGVRRQKEQEIKLVDVHVCVFWLAGPCWEFNARFAAAA